MKTNSISKLILTAATALFLAACGGPEPTPGPVVGEVEGPDTPTGTPLNVQITVDGNMSEWDALTDKERWEVTVPDGAAYTAAKRMLVTYNENYLYLYIEYDGSPEAKVGILDLYFDTDAAFDADGKATTGAGSGNWVNDGTELLAQGPIAEYDPDIFTDTGDPVTGDWDWAELIKAGTGAIKGSAPATLDNGNTAIEIEISRSALTLEGEALIGMQLETSDWSSCGALPQLPAADGEFAAAEKLRISFTGSILPGQGGGGNTPVTPTVEPLNAQITIDGDKADWDALKEDERWLETLPEGALYTAFKNMMVTYNEAYIYVFIEYDGSEEAGVGILDIFMDTDAAFDDKGFATTGMNFWNFENDGSDILAEGAISNYDPDVFMFAGEPLSGGWEWGDPIMTAGSGAVKGFDAIELENGNKAIEIEITRSALVGLGDKMLIGVQAQKPDWSAACGVLPQGPAVDNSIGRLEKLLIDLKGRPGSGEAPVTPPTPGPSTDGIAIDGNLSEWDKVDSSNGYVCELPEGASYAAAYCLKATYNKDYLYFYVEYDGSAEAGVANLAFYFDTDVAFDADGFATTGAGTWLFANDGTELLVQGAIAKYDADISLYSGTALANQWAWTPVAGAGSGIMKGSDPVDLDNGHKAVEIEIMRAGLPGLGNELYLGILLQNAEWGEVGVLPQQAAVDGQFTSAEKIHMTLQ